MRKRWIIFFLLFLIIGSFFLLDFLFRQGFLSQTLTGRVESALAEGLGRKITIRRVTLNLLPVFLEIEGMRMEEPSVMLKRGRVYFHPWSLLTEILFVTRLVLEEPEITVVWPLTSPPVVPTTGDRPRFPVVIRLIEMTGAKVHLRSPVQEIEAQIQGIDAEIRPDLRMERIGVRATAQGGSFFFHPSSPDLAVTQTFGRIEWKGLIHPDRVEVKGLTLVSGASSLSLRGEIRRQDPLEVSLSIDSLLSPKDLSFHPLSTEIGGSFEVRAEVEGKGTDIVARGKVSAQDLSFRAVPLGTVAFRFSSHWPSVLLTEIQARLANGELKGQVSLAGDTGAYRADLEMIGMVPRTFSPFFPDLPLVDTRVSGKVEIKGVGDVLSTIQAKGRITLARGEQNTPSSSRIDSLFSLIEEGEVLFGLENETLSLSELRLRSARSLLLLRGQVGKILDVEVGLESTGMEEFTRLLGFPFGGDVDFSGRFGGTPSHPTFQGGIGSKALHVRERSVGLFHSDIAYQDERLSFTRASLIKGSSRYQASGQILFQNPSDPHLEFVTKVFHGNLQEVVALFSRKLLPLTVPVSGAFRYNGRLRAFQITGLFSLEKGSLYDQEVEAGEVEVVLTEEKVLLKRVSLRQGRSKAQGRGEISFTGGFLATVSSSKLHLEDLSVLKKNLPHLSGMAVVDFSGKGSFEDPQGRAIISAVDLQYGGIGYGAGRLEITIQKKVLTTSLTLLDQGLSARGKVPLGGNDPIQAELLFTDFRVDPFFRPFNPGLLSPISLIVSGRVQMEHGSGGIRAQARLSKVLTDVMGYAVSLDGETTLSLQGRDLQFSPLRFKGEGTFLTISGGVRFFEGYNLFINGEADLSLFRLFTREITQGKGKAFLAMKVTDQWTDPTIRGGLTVQEGMIRSATFSHVIQIHSLGIFFNEKQILLESLEGDIGKGHLQGSGRVDLTEFIPEKFGFLLEFSSVPLPPLVVGLSSVVDGTILFQGAGERQEVRGDILLKKATYEKRVDWATWLLEFARPEKEYGIPFLGSAQLNVHLHGQEHIVIDNNLAKIPLQVDLFLRGTGERPQLLGRIEAKGGKAYFRQNEFRVLTGSVDFVTPQRLIPHLDVKAHTKTRGHGVDLSLTGTPERFALTLTSDPPLPETDILALLTVGKTAEEIAKIQTGIGQGEATSLLFKDFIEEQAQKFTGVDRIQVDPYYSSPKSPSGARLTVEKRLLEDKLSILYSAALDLSAEQIIRVEYLLGRNMALVGERDEQGRLGGDIKFRIEFR